MAFIFHLGVPDGGVIKLLVGDGHGGHRWRGFMWAVCRAHPTQLKMMRCWMCVSPHHTKSSSKILYANGIEWDVILPSVYDVCFFFLRVSSGPKKNADLFCDIHNFIWRVSQEIRVAHSTKPQVRAQHRQQPMSIACVDTKTLSLSGVCWIGQCCCICFCSKNEKHVVHVVSKTYKCIQ